MNRTDQDLNRVYKQKPNCISRKVEDEMVIVPIREDLADMDYLFTLNETAAFIWNHLNGRRDLAVIAELLTEEFEVDYQQACQDVLHTISEIREFVEEKR